MRIGDAVHVDQRMKRSTMCCNVLLLRLANNSTMNNALTPCYITFFERLCINGLLQKRPQSQQYLQYCFQQMSIGCYVRRTKLDGSKSSKAGSVLTNEPWQWIQNDYYYQHWKNTKYKQTGIRWQTNFILAIWELWHYEVWELRNAQVVYMATQLKLTLKQLDRTLSVS
jgi:hypothetical protein